MEPIAYLTVEVKHRELESRILIAAHMIERGFPVIIGQQWSLFHNVAALPPGVVLFKTVNDIQAKNMANFQELGHLVAATDEEVLLCMEDICFMLAFGPIAADNCDLFLAQNEHHKAAIARRFPLFADKIEVVGNPRIDLLAPQGRATFAQEAAAIREEHGPFVLFNTNYGTLNSIWNSIDAVAAIAAKAGAFDPNDPQSVSGFQAAIDWERKNFEEMRPLLKWAIKNLPNHKIVLRPHPGERPESWQQLLAAAPNAVVVPRSNPHPWIMAADLIVHTGCTTGLEAGFMDKPCVNVAPSKHPVFDRIVNWANPTFTTWQAAAEAISAYLTEGRGPIVDNAETYRNVLGEYFPGYAEGQSGRVIAKKLIQLLLRHGAQVKSPYKFRFRAPYQPYKRHETLKDKFSISMEEFVALYERMCKFHNLKANVELQPLDDSLFMMRPV
ncbi:MAG: surface carbohydrate biosynthesis protein [Rhodospirillaceae bacterium]